MTMLTVLLLLSVLLNTWEPVMEKNGAKVEARALAGKPYKEHRVSVHLPLTIEQVDAYFRDGFRKLIDKRVTRKVIASTPEKMTFHDRIKMPIGDDRDFVIDMNRSFDNETKVLAWRFKGIDHPSAPPSKDCVRMVALAGEWVFEPSEGGGSDLTYVVYSDPGGDFPRAMVASTQANAAVERVTNVVNDAKASLR